MIESADHLNFSQEKELQYLRNTLEALVLTLDDIILTDAATSTHTSEFDNISKLNSSKFLHHQEFSQILKTFIERRLKDL